MSPRSNLPRLVVLIVGRVVPSRAAATVTADLDADYGVVRTRVSRVRAAWWLLRETASIVRAYAAAPLSATASSGPVWFRDLVLVGRALRSRPVAAVTGAAMLSIGITAVLVTGALSSALLFRSVSASHGDAVRRIAAADRQGRSILRLSYPELQIIRERVGNAATIAVVNLQPVVARVSGTSVQTMAEVVDGDYFALAGVTTIVGRGLMAADDRAGSPRVAVIAQPFWRDRLASSASALGQTVALNGEAFTIVGVARVLGSSSFLGASVDVWVPLAHADPVLNRGWRTNAADRWFTSYVLAVSSLAETEARLANAANDLARLFPDPWRDRRLQTIAGTVLVGNQRRTVVMLAAILSAFALLILMVAAANLGGLLLARAAAGRRTVAIHLSLGSGRSAAARRVLIEGAVLGLGAAALTLAAYAWARTWFSEVGVLPTLALRLDLAPVSAVATFVVAGGLASGIALAIGPALWASRVDAAAALRDEGTRATGGRSIAGTRRALVAVQVALALVLVVGAALFTRSLDALSNVDAGFDRSRLVAMDFDVEPSLTPPSQFPGLAREALTRVSAIPGITGVAMSNRAPIDQSTPAIEVRSGDAPVVADVSMYLATPGYFDTIALALTAGRSFTQTEADAEADVVIVNEALAERLFRGDAIDRVLTLVADQKTVRVVGVARNSKYRALAEPSRPHLYRPTSPRLSLTLLARTSGDPYESLRVIQQTLDGIGPGLVGFFPRTLRDHVEIELLPTRAAAGAARWLGVLALVLSAVGLYGLVAWFVELRRREIGVRMALGASARDVRTLVVKQALKTALPGLVVGLLLAAGLGTLARTALFGVTPFDPVAVAAAIGALVLLVSLGSYLPSRRATRLDPAAVLRS
jgi:predicted permease